MAGFKGSNLIQLKFKAVTIPFSSQIISINENKLGVEKLLHISLMTNCLNAIILI